MDETIEETYKVTIRSYGSLEKVRRENLLALSRVLHARLGVGRWVVEDPAGDRWTFDPLADDGHHEGHGGDPMVRLP